jgi:chemotaxis protein methyltransferase CheR
MSIANGVKPLRQNEGVSFLLRDLVHERTGIFFEDSRVDLLLEKLEPLGQKRGCESFLDYYYALKDNHENEWERAWEALSVQETYFWREMAQIEALAGSIVPAWFGKTSAKFHIWSAACATGEEPYSIAMALLEAGFGSHPIEILASDASPAAIQKAANATYRERSFRSFPPHLRGKYFHAVDNGWKLSPEVTRRVQFRRVNLLEPAEISAQARVQAIFCRNVFIYFSPHSIRIALAIMAKKMASSGHLFVGASESLWRMTTDFELKEIAGALAYERI